MEIKATVRGHFSPSRLANTTDGKNTYLHRGCGAVARLTHGWWEYDLVMVLESYLTISFKINITQTIGPQI